LAIIARPPCADPDALRAPESASLRPATSHHLPSSSWVAAQCTGCLGSAAVATVTGTMGGEPISGLTVSPGMFQRGTAWRGWGRGRAE
jgi:hypothetical protein